MDPEFSDEDILGGYYSALEPHGGLPHARGVEKVAERIVGKVGGDKDTVHEKVLQIFSDVTGPEYLKPAALDVISRAILRNGEVYIWTVGDHGEGSHYYQRAKIEASNVEERLGQIAQKHGKTPEDIREHFHVRITPANKHEELSKIMDEISQQGIDAVYLADDKESNVAAAKEVAGGFPGIDFHDWIIKPDDDVNGNLTAFAAYLDRETMRQQESGKRFAVILDWDDTLTNEIERMRAVRARINEHFTPLNVI